MTELENNNHFKPRIQHLNPFIHKINLNTYYNYFKLTFMSIFIVPLRVIGIMMCLIIAYIIASLALWGISEEELEARPLSGWRRTLRWYEFALGRTMIRFFGYSYVRVIGKCATAAEAPIMVAAPHTSFFDGIVPWWSADVCPGVVSRVENNDVPFFGKCIRYVQSVHVERQAEKSRKSSVKAIMDRVNSKEDWPPIVIFPEGTCTNGQCLISFKLGAFLPGVPIQPVVIRYKNKTQCTTWTADGPGVLQVIYLSLCQFNSFCEIEYLPVYTPSAQEKKNAHLFATNVRHVMAKAIDLPVTEYSFEDARLMVAAKSLKLPAEAGLIEFQKLRRNYGIDMKSVREDFLSQFAKMANKNGLVDIHGFANGLHLPVSDALIVKLFNSYDLAGRGTLNFEEYVNARCALVKTMKDSTMIERTYPFFGGSKSLSEKITRNAFTQEWTKAFNVQPEECLKIFKMADIDDTGFISDDGYNRLAKIAPEYIWIIFQHLQNGHGVLAKNSAIDDCKSKAE